MSTLTELLNQHPRPTHTILHISDTHFAENDARLYNAIDTDAHLRQLFEGLAESAIVPDALVFTGDLTDNGQADGYRRLRSIVEPVCEAYGAELIWVMGNHDSRLEFRKNLFDFVPRSDAVPGRADAAQDNTESALTSTDRAWENIDYSVDLGGLRIIALDSTVPGENHGEIEDAQYTWLREQLATPAEHGTLLALHHPPVPTPIEVLRLVELREQHLLEAALEGTDVRAVLAGHFHYSAASTLPSGIPVSVAGATCFTHDTRSPAGKLYSRDGALGCNLVEVYPDRVVHTVVPLGAFPLINVTGLHDLFPDE